MGRIYYDASKYLEEKAKLPKPDGVHCVICGKDLPKFKRKYCSDECYQRWYEGLAIRSWMRVRDKVLERDHYTCQKCGTKEVPNNHNTYLEVHHIIPIHEGGEEFDPDNCITLCQKCHKFVHSHVGKIKRQHKTLEQWGVV